LPVPEVFPAVFNDWHRDALLHVTKLCREAKGRRKLPLARPYRTGGILTDATQAAWALALAVALWAAAVLGHALSLPRPLADHWAEIGAARREEVKVHLQMSLLFVVYATTFWKFHPALGEGWTAVACWWSTVSMFSLIALIFIFSAYQRMASAPTVGAVIFQFFRATSAALAPLMLWTLAKAARKRREQREATARGYSAHAEEVRSQVLGAS
jgi:hypothetical protein